MNDSKFEVLWHAGYDSYQKTIIESKQKPETGEAAQIVSVIEDRRVDDIRVDAIKEVGA